MDLCKSSLNRLSCISLGFFLVTTACQKSNTAAEAIESVDQLSCPSGQFKASGEMEIQSSASTGDVNSVLQFKLNTDALCSGAQKVQWNVPGATKLLSKGGIATAQYSAPGEYVVAATLTGGDVGNQQLMTKATVMGEQIQFSGPQVTTVFRDNVFSLIAPSGTTLTSIQWDFGDGNGAVTTEASTTHAYRDPGVYTLRVTAMDNASVITTIEHYVSVLQDSDELFCATQLAVSAPSETHVGDANMFSVYMPACVRNHMNRVSWNFGDQTTTDGESVEKIYNATGLYTVTVIVHLNNPQIPTISITRRIQVNDAQVENNCPTEGQTRVSYGANFDEQENCGINGKKTVTYRNRQNEACSREGNVLDWILVSTEKEQVSEGECRGQACPVPGNVPTGVTGLLLINGQYYLPDGASYTFFTSSAPQNSCDANKVVRSCANGVLSGSTTNLVYQCQSGCGDFGPNGTVKTGINIGTIQVPVQCQFGEQGIFDVFNQIEDRACTNGSVNNSNQRLGALITKGQCPTYSYHSTGQYTTCSADCGGLQSLIYECRNNSGQKVDNSRCAGQVQLERSRQCDANPETVRRVDVTTVAEEDNTSKKCPKNEIGVILQSRDKVTKKTYACIQHKVALESTVVQYTPWVEERYCRDYVAYRCNGDSLNNAQSQGRHEWMMKCSSEVPMLKEFLDNFENVKAGNISLETTRSLYPTFMDSSTKPEKLWKAPTAKTGSCVVPRGVYIAAVCVSSCALPQEQVLAQSGRGAMGPVEFIKALTEKYERISTMTKNSTISDRRLKASKVEQWVTELVDTEQPVLLFTMESGKTLSVTPNHPLLRKDGSMDTAESFKTGDSLVALGGEQDPIRSIESIIYYGKVYNVFVKSSVPQENIIVTNGYLNGSAYFQNEGAGNMNKTLLRKKLTKGIFE